MSDRTPQVPSNEELVALTDKRNALAELRNAIGRSDVQPIPGIVTSNLDQQIAELDHQMAELILRHAYAH